MVRDAVFTLAMSGFGVVFAIVGLAMVNQGRKSWSRSGRIAETETTAIRQLRPGPVEVKGTARLPEDASVLRAPITGAEALATRVEVEEWQSSGQGGGSWKTIHEDDRAVPMIVDDGDEVLVELPPEGRLNVERTRTTVGSGDEPPEQIRRFVEGEREVEAATRHDLGPISIGDRRRYSEGVIEPGEEVYVLGTAREIDADWGERRFAIDEPTESDDFVLSDKSERELISEGRRGGLVKIGFGALLTVVGVGVAVIPWAGP